MNLIKGQIVEGFFMAAGIALEMKGHANHPDMVLGIRPEDCQIVQLSHETPQGALHETHQGAIGGRIYSCEMTGDAVLVTIEAGDQKLCARADRHFQGSIGDKIALRPDPAYLHLFDGVTGKRL